MIPVRSGRHGDGYRPAAMRLVAWRRLALSGLAIGLGLGWATGAMARGTPDGFADLAAKLSPAVVNVSTIEKAPAPAPAPAPDTQMPPLPPGSPLEDFFKNFFDHQGQGARPPSPVISLGSGFIIDPAGYIVTNNHVIADADQIKVILADQKEYTAKLVGTDTKTDVAVLKIVAPAPLPAVHFGNSDVARVGDWVLAIGNPFGLGGSVTAGILSAKDRDIRSGPYDDFLQTDAAINKGNSGGPLFNMQGEVIGINSAIFSQSGGSVGIGFAVPAKIAAPVVAQLIKYGHVRRGWLGVRIQSVTDEIAEALALKGARGALVAGVSPGSPAEKAGILPGDVVLSFDGKPVPDVAKLPRMVAETPIGKNVPVELWRKGRAVTLTVVIGELREEDETAASAGTKPKAPGAATPSTAIASLGFSVAPLSPALRQRYAIAPDAKGVVVVAVVPDGIAASRDLKVGDVIVEFEQSPVTAPAEILDRLKTLRASGRKVALLIVEHGGDQHILTLPLPSEKTPAPKPEPEK